MVLLSFPLPRWLNKLGLASIQYEPTVQNPAAGEPPFSCWPEFRWAILEFWSLTFSLRRVLQWSQRPRRSRKHRNPPSALHGPEPAGLRWSTGTSWWDTSGQPRLNPSTRFLRQNGTCKGVLSPFRGPSPLLTPQPSRWPLTGHCPPPSAPWRRTAPPPRWPSSGSPGWTWCPRRPPPPPRKRPWCAWRRFTRSDPQRPRRQTGRCWQAPLSRILWKLSPMRKMVVGRKRRPRRRLQKLHKVRLDFRSCCAPAWPN